MKIPFDIKYRPQIESGEYKVVYGNNCYPVKILMWDFKDPEGYCILGYYEDKEGQHAVMYNNSGKLYHDKESMFGLFLITPEPKLSEFEKKLSDIVGYAISLSITEPQKPTSEFVKEYAAELLELAKNEIYSHKSLVEYAETAREEGKSEVLKDLPRWKKHEEASDKLAMVWNDFVTPWLDWRGHRIAVRGLEKLPGFNN